MARYRSVVLLESSQNHPNGHLNVVNFPHVTVGYTDTLRSVIEFVNSRDEVLCSFFMFFSLKPSCVLLSGGCCWNFNYSSVGKKKETDRHTAYMREKITRFTGIVLGDCSSKLWSLRPKTFPRDNLFGVWNSKSDIYTYFWRYDTSRGLDFFFQICKHQTVSFRKVHNLMIRFCEFQLIVVRNLW